MKSCHKTGSLFLILLFLVLSPTVFAQASKGVSVYKITPVQSKIDFSDAIAIKYQPVASDSTSRALHRYKSNRCN